jgi:hypothetical protein
MSQPRNCRKCGSFFTTHDNKKVLCDKCLDGGHGLDTVEMIKKIEGEFKTFKRPSTSSSKWMFDFMKSQQKEIEQSKKSFDASLDMYLKLCGLVEELKTCGNCKYIKLSMDELNKPELVCIKRNLFTEFGKTCCMWAQGEIK